MKLNFQSGKPVVTCMATILLVAGCAKSPSSIAPVAVASSEYDGLSCASAKIELSSVEAKLADATRRQNNAQAGDAIGVFLFLVPISALAGDAESDVALYKGEKLALERAIERKNCGTVTASTQITFPSVEARDIYYNDLIENVRKGAETDVTLIVSKCGSPNSEQCKAKVRAVETSRDARIAELESARLGASVNGS